MVSQLLLENPIGNLINPLLWRSAIAFIKVRPQS
jgi:hypothetical protein